MDDVVSVIVPTYNEKDNISKLIERIKAAVQNETKRAEILVVDDNSPDGTGTIIESLSQKNKNENVRIGLVSRKEKKGLSSAIIDGFKSAQGKECIVMDADFSHPPELIPLIIRELDAGYDLVIASRYMPGGRTEGWTFTRKNLSRLAMWIAKRKFKLIVTDPLSGFFGINKDSIAKEDFHAMGYKILLEILVRRQDLSVKELPYTFVNRDEGRSKMGIKNIIDYLRLLRKL